MEGGIGRPVSPNALLALLGTEDEEAQPQGLGPLLDAPDDEAFRSVHEMVVRQEPLARSRLAQDMHFAAIASGYNISSLVKVQDRDVYQQELPPGRLYRSAVPNKAADLCRKMVASLTVDPAKPDPEPEDDSETAVAGADLAKEFLRQDGSEDGTDDAATWNYLLLGATSKASTFAHLWVDPSGEGSVAKQVKAHPQATDPAHPLDAVDPATGRPIPTTDYVLRYVTEGGQFTRNPSEAARVWLPKIRVDKLDRRHVRVYPETATPGDADKVVLLWYTTIGEARRRWPETVGAMDATKLSSLCDWQPPRATVLLPPALRARTKESAPGDRKGEYGDDRFFFFYLLYVKACPEYPTGGYRYLSGANGGTTLDVGSLGSEVTIPDGATQDATVTDTRIGDIPLVDLTLVPDPEGGDPMGVSLLGFVSGANEAASTLMTGLLQEIDRVLNPATFVTSLSPLTADDIQQSRATGKPAVVLSKDDVPVLEEPVPLPAATQATADWLYTQMDSAIGLSQAAQGADESPEVSGIARRIAVNQSLVAVGPMQAAYHRALAKYWRLKLQLAMQHFSVPQLLRYTGVDGAAKQEWFTGNNFALVGGVSVAAGTGTLFPPTERVNYVLQLRDAGLIDEDEVDAIARPAVKTALGANDNVHVQRIERQVSTWLEGAPKGWVEQATAYQAEQDALAQMTASQPPMVDPISGQPVAPQLPQPTVPLPWTPFATLPMDGEAPIATIRKRRLARLMAGTAFTEQPPAWQQVAIAAYEEAVAALRATQMASAMNAAPQAGPPQQITDPSAGTVGVAG